MKPMYEIISVAARDVRVGDELYNSALARYQGSNKRSRSVFVQAFEWVEVTCVGPCGYPVPYRTEYWGTVEMVPLRIQTRSGETFKLPQEGIVVRRWTGPDDEEECRAWEQAGKPGLGAWEMQKLDLNE